MYSDNSSLSKLHNQNKVFLSPIKRVKKKKILHQKENNFVLDCTNKQKSRLEEYNYLKDKYLNYCVVKIAKRKRIIVNSPSKSRSCNDESDANVLKDSINFKNFLKSKREEIILKAHQFNDPKLVDKATQQDKKKIERQTTLQEKNDQQHNNKVKQIENTIGSNRANDIQTNERDNLSNFQPQQQHSEFIETKQQQTNAPETYQKQKFQSQKQHNITKIQVNNKQQV